MPEGTEAGSANGSKNNQENNAEENDALIAKPDEEANETQDPLYRTID